ncbi:MAG: hypothetical protein M3O70_03385 [Actinomycetota bacterium]|nr:hypothetical protein [Actinomycetota bacterium]
MVQPPTWTVVVIRAWRELDGVRVRLLRRDSLGDEEQDMVVASTDEAGSVVGRWLREFAGERSGDVAATPPETPAQTNDRRRRVRRGHGR